MRYLTADTNPGGGIGHQFANWNTAYYLAHQYRLTFVHRPFKRGYEDYLGLGVGEVQYDDIVGRVETIEIPTLGLETQEGIDQFEAIIGYRDNVLFHLAMDQNLYDHTKNQMAVREKFWSGKERFPFPKDKTIIAVHIRRGNLKECAEVMQKRFIPNSYFIGVVNQLVKLVPNPEVHVFSEADPNDFADFGDVVIHSKDRVEDLAEMREALSGMASSDILVMAQSGFPYFAGIVSDGIKLARYPFWHNIPDSCNGWVRIDSEGHFNNTLLKERFG